MPREQHVAEGVPVSWDDVHDSRAGFRACLEAFSRPGIAIDGAPRPHLSDDRAEDAAAGVLLSLLDPGLALAAAGGAATSELASRLRELTGAVDAPVEEADFVLAGAGRAPDVATRARRGSALAPDRGATLVVVSGMGERCEAELNGPGVAGTFAVEVPLTAADLAALERANAAPPQGVDVIATAADGSLVGLPRSVVGG